jgi:CBS domain-containing protein
MMFIEALLQKAREKLVVIEDGARLIDAAKLLRRGTDLVIVTDPAGILVGVVTRTDIVNQFGFCEESSCVADI